MACANVLCFCETWLSPSQQIPSLGSGHVTLRCDRIAPNNKGGVLSSVHQSLNPHQTATVNTKGVEGLITKLMLPNSRHIQLVLLYRSPNTPIDSFVSVLTSIVSHIQVNSVPTIVMGDMNDCVSNQVNTKLTNVMSSHGYTQLVKSPTTDSGTIMFIIMEH